MVETIPYTEIARGLLTHPNKERPLIFLMLKLLGVHRLPMLAPALKLLRRSRVDMGRHLDALGEQLDKHGEPWIAGADFSLADVSWVVILDRLAEADWDGFFWGGDRRPVVAAYWQRLRARPSYAAAIEDVRGENVRRGIAEVKLAKARDPRLLEALEGA
jgi:glutathione S-transferase